MEHGGYGISASDMDSRVASLWPSVISIDVLEQLAPFRMTFGYGGYDIVTATELDSPRVQASQRTSRTIDVLEHLEHLARMYPAGATPYSYGRRTRLIMRSQYGVTEYFDEHGAVVRVDYGYDDPYGNGRFGAVPASEAEIARLPAAKAGEVREKDCAVCLECFEDGEEIRKMTCPSSHGFHENCIFKWLRVSRLCPLCRYTLLAKQEEDEDEDDGDEADSDEETDETTTETAEEEDAWQLRELSDPHGYFEYP